MIAATLLVVVACAAPWAFGAVEPLWWASAAALCLAVALGPLGRAALRGPPPDELPSRALRLAAALPLVALLGLVPIPMALRRIVSPTAAEVLADADPSAVESWRPLSLDPHATLGASAVAAACAATFWIIGRAARTESHARRLSALLIAGGTALALFGLWHYLGHYDQRAVFWGAWKVDLPDVATPFGPYVNRNHFAGAMLAFAGLGAGAALHARAARRWLAAGAAGAAASAAVVALVATKSRGALAGLVVLAAFLVALSGRGRRGRVLLALLAVLAALIAALWSFGVFDDLAARFHLVPEGRERNRFAVQWDALRVFAGNPVFGTGAGTFAGAYPPFQSVDDVRFFSNAHSDWAQFLMETGLVGAAFAAAAAREAVSSVRRAAASPDPSRWLVLGPAAGCAATCAHGLFETNLHTPANALLFAATLSLAYGASIRHGAPV